MDALNGSLGGNWERSRVCKEAFGESRGLRGSCHGERCLLERSGFTSRYDKNSRASLVEAVAKFATIQPPSLRDLSRNSGKAFLED